jgi:peptide/nickel transport system permease protein
MLSYIAHRVLAAIPTVLIIIVIGFFLMELPPGDYVSFYISELARQGTAASEDQIEMLRRIYALDEPVHIRFVNWLWKFVQGDFGMSFAYREPVRDLVMERIWMTLGVSIFSLVISWAIGIPVGVYSATHQYELGDQIFTFLAFFGVGVPSFMVAMVLIVVGMRWMGFVPLGLFSEGFRDAPWSFAKFVDLMKHLWIPASIVAITGTAGLMRVMRGNLLDELNRDYIQTARAKGLKESKVVWKHGVRNALHPLIMNLGMAFPRLISGTAIVGIVLNLPVMGAMYLNAVREQDIYLGGTFLILITLMTVVGNLFADILLAVVDPRIRYH